VANIPPNAVIELENVPVFTKLKPASGIDENNREPLTPPEIAFGAKQALSAIVGKVVWTPFKALQLTYTLLPDVGNVSNPAATADIVIKISPKANTIETLILLFCISLSLILIVYKSGR
jgi:hypothetical protein